MPDQPGSLLRDYAERRRASTDALFADPAPEAPPEPEGDPWYVTGPGLVPELVRVVGGLTAMPGIGAATAGGAEALAQILEGRGVDELSKTRIGVEAGLGATGIGNKLQALARLGRLGKVGGQALAGGLFTGASEGARQWDEEGGIDPAATAGAAGLGAILGPVAGKGLERAGDWWRGAGRAGAPATAAPPTAPDAQLDLPLPGQPPRNVTPPPAPAAGQPDTRPRLDPDPQVEQIPPFPVTGQVTGEGRLRDPAAAAERYVGSLKGAKAQFPENPLLDALLPSAQAESRLARRAATEARQDAAAATRGERQDVREATRQQERQENLGRQDARQEERRAEAQRKADQQEFQNQQQLEEFQAVTEGRVPAEILADRSIKATEPGGATVRARAQFVDPGPSGIGPRRAQGVPPPDDPDIRPEYSVTREPAEGQRRLTEGTQQIEGGGDVPPPPQSPPPTAPSQPDPPQPSGPRLLGEGGEPWEVEKARRATEANRRRYRIDGLPETVGMDEHLQAERSRGRLGGEGQETFEPVSRNIPADAPTDIDVRQPEAGTPAAPEATASAPQAAPAPAETLSLVDIFSGVVGEHGREAGARPGLQALYHVMKRMQEAGAITGPEIKLTGAGKALGQARRAAKEAGGPDASARYGNLAEMFGWKGPDPSARQRGAQPDPVTPEAITATSGPKPTESPQRGEASIDDLVQQLDGRGIPFEFRGDRAVRLRPTGGAAVTMHPGDDLDEVMARSRAAGRAGQTEVPNPEQTPEVPTATINDLAADLEARGVRFDFRGDNAVRAWPSDGIPITIHPGDDVPEAIARSRAAYQGGASQLDPEHLPEVPTDEAGDIAQMAGEAAPPAPAGPPPGMSTDPARMERTRRDLERFNEQRRAAGRPELEIPGVSPEPPAATPQQPQIPQRRAASVWSTPEKPEAPRNLSPELEARVREAQANVTPEDAARTMRETSPFMGAGRGGDALAAILGGGIGAYAGAQGQDEDGIAEAGPGMLGGALLGALAGPAAGRMINPGHLADRASNALRASLLTSTNLPSNVIGAPLGAGVTTALEEALAGNTGTAKSLIGEMHPRKLARRWDEGLNWAEKAMRSGEQLQERADYTSVPGREHTWVDEVLSRPGRYLMASDQAMRAAMQSAGISEGAARQATLTSRPRSEVGNWLAGPSNNPAVNILAPFRRTLVNLIEQGADRVPGLGELTQRHGRQGAPVDDWRHRAAQQGLGGATMAGGAWAEQQIQDDALEGIPVVGDFIQEHGLEDLSKRVARGALTNTAGRYALPMAMGLGTGHALANNEPLIQGLTAGAARGLGEVPLPSPEIPINMLEFTGKALSDDRPEGAFEWIDQAPGGTVPGLAKEAVRWADRRGHLPDWAY